ncbi:DEAD/DEAH box helicase [Bacillus sp. JCM 19041]|uniref:DEAD/DEAH box helicase n=1 Tax=Bacillus sp. JCM 19041 TaxID=1460637 RepID=UPI000ACD49D0
MIFGEIGTFAKAFASFEERPGQRKMMNEVHDAFNDHAHALIEAGTGTGKSMAYLVPSAYYAKTKKKPVVISTYTIPLQEQLLQRDLRLLASVLPFSIKTAVLKGRGNYLDLRKFEHAMQQPDDDSYDVRLTKAQILIWLLETDYGDVEELNLSSGGKTFWLTVQSDGVSDLGKYNPWFSRCFYHRSRRNAQSADLIITNHALLLTDVVQSNALLPTYSHAVIDEAHHLEEAASNHFGVSTSYLSFGFAISRLGEGQDHSAIQKLLKLAKAHGLTLTLKNAEEALSLLKEDVDELFRMIHVFALGEGNNATDVGRISYVFKSFSEQGSLWQAILECAMRIQLHGEKTLAEVTQAYTLVSEEKELTYATRATLADIQAAIAMFEEQVQSVYELLLEYDDQFVYWIEAEPKGQKMPLIYMQSRLK